MDLFADTKNAKTAVFYSRYRCPGASGTNAFSVPWTCMVAWICPPVTKIPEVVKRIVRSEQLTGVLVIPVWQTAVFWPFISPDGIHVTECFGKVVSFRPFIIQGETNDCKNLLRGFTPFPFLALYITNAGKGCIRAGKIRLPAEALAQT